MAIHHPVDHATEPHNPLTCHGCAILTLIHVRRTLTALNRRLPDTTGPGEVSDALRAILNTIPSYTPGVREEPAPSLEDSRDE